MARVQYPAVTGVWVCIGAVPFAALGLPPELYADAWGQQLTYAVLQSLTTPAPALTDTTLISILDGSGTVISNQASFVLVSSGETGKGARSLATGNVTDACSATDLDRTNCQGLGVFRDAHYNDINGSPLFFDDIVNWSTLLAMSPSNSSCSGMTVYGTWNGDAAAALTGSGCNDTIKGMPNYSMLSAPGLVYWFDAKDIDGSGSFNDGRVDGSQVVTWVNKASAGGGRNATCGTGVTFNRAGLDGFNSVAFNGTTNGKCTFDLSLLNNSDYAIYIVFGRVNSNSIHTLLSTQYASSAQKMVITGEVAAAGRCDVKIDAPLAALDNGARICTQNFLQTVYAATQNSPTQRDFTHEMDNGNGITVTDSGNFGQLSGLTAGSPAFLGIGNGNINPLSGSILQVMIFKLYPDVVAENNIRNSMEHYINFEMGAGDTMVGGAGADIFVIPDNDKYTITVNDFVSGTDKLDISALHFTPAMQRPNDSGFAGGGVRSFYIVTTPSASRAVKFDMTGTGAMTTQVKLPDPSNVPVTGDFIFK